MSLSWICTMYLFFVNSCAVSLQLMQVLLRSCTCTTVVMLAIVCVLKVCDMYEWVHSRWCYSLPALPTHLPPTLHWWLADAVVHMPILHGARRRCTAHDLRNKLEQRCVVEVTGRLTDKPTHGQSARGPVISPCWNMTFHPLQRHKVQ